MKICILTHTFPKHKNDFTAPFMDGVAFGQAEAGNEVIVLTPFSPGFNRKKTDQKYKIVTYKYVFPNSFHKIGYSQTLTNDIGVKPIMYLLSPLMYFFGLIALVRLIRREKIDIINAHWILPNGFIASIATLITGVPTISTLPGSDVYMAKKPVFRWMAKFATKYSKSITSNSPQLLDDLARINEPHDTLKRKSLQKKFSSIVYGTYPNLFKPDGRLNKSLRTKHGIPANDVVVLGVGRLVAKKGFEYLIKAAPGVLKKNKNTTFVVIGEGDQRQKLEELSKKLKVYDKFRFTGWVKYDDLLHYYNLADVFILPSIRDEEGNLDDQSVSVVEAMSCGKPIITTNFPGYKIVVENGSNGYLINPKNHIEIEAALIKLAADNSLRTKMGKRSRDLVIRKFNWKSIGKQYTKLFKSVVNTN